MFSNITSTHTVSWLAYPSYSLTDDFSLFELMPGLYYQNRIEWAASAMEMSVIAARNVANLASNYIKDAEKNVNDNGNERTTTSGTTNTK